MLTSHLLLRFTLLNKALTLIDSKSLLADLQVSSRLDHDHNFAQSISNHLKVPQLSVIYE